MRVIEADDLEAARSREPPGVEMILRVDQEPIRVVGQVAAANRLDDLVGAAQENAAAFDQRSVSRVRGDRFKNAWMYAAILNS